MPPPAPDAAHDPAAARRELYFLTLYRLLEAALLCLVVFGPAAALLAPPRDPVLGRIVAVAYLGAALLLFHGGRRGRIRTQVLLGAAVDIGCASLAMHALPQLDAGIAMMMLFNVGAAALLLPLRLGLGVGLAASATFAAEYGWTLLDGREPGHSIAELSMFSVS